MKKIALINSNTLPGTAGYIRCEKICVETTKCFEPYDDVGITREINKSEDVRIFFYCNEMTSSMSNINVYRENLEDNDKKILQSSVYYSIIKYTGLNCKKNALGVLNDPMLISSDIPSILIKVRYSCEETGFELLAEDVARGCSSAVAEFIGAELKSQYINNCFYVKRKWDNINSVREKFFLYDSAIYRAKITLCNLYNYDGKCLAVFYQNERKKSEVTKKHKKKSGI